MKRAALYLRVSTIDQHPETQLCDLRQLAAQRGLEIVEVYTDHGVSGIRVRRPALDKMMADASRHHFDVVLVWSFDRLARSVVHLLQTLDELNHLGIEFVSVRENIDSGGPLGRAIMVIIGAIAELERSLIIERVRAGLRRARLEGRRLGRPPRVIDRDAILADRARGHSLTEVAKLHQISRALVSRVIKEAMTGGHKTPLRPPLQAADSARPN